MVMVKLGLDYTKFIG